MSGPSVSRTIRRLSVKSNLRQVENNLADSHLVRNLSVQSNIHLEGETQMAEEMAMFFDMAMKTEIIIFDLLPDSQPGPDIHFPLAP